MPDYGAEFVTEYLPVYGGGTLSGPGRWFRTDDGYVWTNDAGNLNLLDFNSPDAIQNFINMKTIAASNGNSAEDIFNQLAGEEPETVVVEGDLATLDALYTQEIQATAEVEENSAYGLTLDDNNQVLELVMIDPSGVHVRDAGEWLLLDPDDVDDENDTVYGREWIDISPEAIVVYDDNIDSDTLTKDDFTPYILN
jgi:hypothetical protein